MIYRYLIFIIPFILYSIDKLNTNNSDFVGNWISIKRIIPYSATLNISNDNTFTFKYRACTSRGSSNGKWELRNDTMILNSYRLDTCLQLEKFGINCVVIELDTIDHSERDKVTSNCNSSDGSLYVEFKDCKFILKNDSLVYLAPNDNPCHYIKDIFTKK